MPLCMHSVVHSVHTAWHYVYGLKFRSAMELKWNETEK